MCDNDIVALGIPWGASGSGRVRRGIRAGIDLTQTYRSRSSTRCGLGPVLPNALGGANVALVVEEIERAITLADGIAVFVPDLLPSSPVSGARLDFAKLLN